jgi:hypothetical protein
MFNCTKEKNNRIFNFEKLEICIYILNHFLHSYYKYFQYIDKHIFAEFTPCGFLEEKEILEFSIRKMLNEVTLSNVNENVIYWSIVYYYFNTIVVEYNALMVFNQYKLNKYINKKLIPELEKQQNVTKIQNVRDVLLLDTEVTEITNLILHISCSDELWTQCIRKIIHYSGTDELYELLVIK